MTIRLAIAGASGRMGRALLAAAADRELRIVGGTNRPGAEPQDLGLLAGEDASGLFTSASVAEAAIGADAFIDFTSPAATLAALDALEGTPVRAVIIGTTGFSAAEAARLDAHASRYALVRSGNFSLGVHMLAGLVRLAAERLPAAGWDIEVLEAHHRHKVDAPSGTALLLGEAAADGRGAALPDLRRAPDDGRTGPRPEGSIGFALRRAGGIVGEHEVMFASAMESLRLAHVAHDRRVFAEGAVTAAQWAAGKPPGLYSMADVLGLNRPA